MRRLVVITFCAILYQCQKVEIITYPHYDIQCKIEPSKKQISVSLQMNYFHPFESTDSLKSLLYKKMKVESVESEMIDQFVFDTSSAPVYRYTPQAGINGYPSKLLFQIILT
jgi:hypothetical protein